MNLNTQTETKNRENSKKIKINEEELELKYSGTKLNKDIYTTTNNEEYIFENNKLVGFLKNMVSNKNKNSNMNMEMAKDIVVQYLKKNEKIITDSLLYEF